MEGYSIVKELGKMKSFDNNSMKFLSIYILIAGIALSLGLVTILGSVVGFGAGINTLVFSGAIWIAGLTLTS